MLSSGLMCQAPPVLWGCGLATIGTPHPSILDFPIPLGWHYIPFILDLADDQSAFAMTSSPQNHYLAKALKVLWTIAAPRHLDTARG